MNVIMEDGHTCPLVIPPDVTPGDAIQAMYDRDEDELLVLRDEGVNAAELATEAKPLLQAIAEQKSTDGGTVYLSENLVRSTFSSPLARRIRSSHGSVQFGTRTVSINLAELATVVRIMTEADAQANVSQANMKVLDACGTVLTQTPGALATQTPVNQSHVQLLRFFNGDVNFTVQQGSDLLRTLEAVPPPYRQSFFSTSILARRKQIVRWPGTTLAPYLLMESHRELKDIRKLRKAINTALSQRNMSALDFCIVIDKDESLLIDVDEVLAALGDAARFPSLAGFDLEVMMKPLLQMADTDRSGQLSYNEMCEFLQERVRVRTG